MSSLITLGVASNKLSGSLPSNNISFPMPPRLKVISLGDNRFTGDVLPSFLQCQDIQIISLSQNLISGSIPAEISTLSKLSILILGWNQLTGTIPPLLGNLTKLTYLELGGNNLSGIIPEELGNLVNLQRLLLGENGNIVGSIPTSLLNLSMLNEFDLSDNSLTGSVPSGIGNSLHMLELFHVGHNQLSSGLEFLSSLSNCKNLKRLQIYRNSLEGVLPDDVGNLSTNLQYFVASINRIKETIPSTLGNLSGLIVLDLGENELTGTIPSTLTKLESLQYMSLQVNGIIGQVPSGLGLMKNLNSLFLGYNKLFGPVPKSLANISFLQILDLDNNKLSRSIPKSLWTLTRLLQLDLSRNNLSGPLPPQVSDLNVLTYLNLSMNLLSDQIPESFGGLISVTSINLSYNYLSGSIPKSLANLSSLYSLDLSFNKLEGQVPKGRVFLNSSIPFLIGNEALCGAPQLHILACDDLVRNDSRRKLLRLKYILLATMLCVVVLTFLCLIYTFYSRRKLKSLPDNNVSLLDCYRVISHYELVCATENFSEANLVGMGGFGSVFRGCLDEGLVVAIKILNLDVDGSSKSFEAECQVLRMVRHKNLIKIISVCSNLDFKALILEYMPNESLERWLYSDNYFLNLIQRLNITVDVSLALEYLHHHHPHVVLHCDLKPSNILLDEGLLARVSDFGIAKLLISDSRSTTTTSMSGTIGYIAPEYATTGTVSRMSDVYSFGILLLETFTGKKPVDSMFGEQSSLREWICKANTIMDVVDENFLKYHSTDDDLQKILRCLSSVIELGLVCSKYSPKERIPMTDVVVRLQKIKIEYLSS